MAPTNLRIAQSEHFEGDDWWSWAVWLDGPTEELDAVDRVEYTLHPSFKHPVRDSTDRAGNFKLETAGWGVFPIHARVICKDGTEQRLRHELTLHYPDGRENTA